MVQKLFAINLFLFTKELRLKLLFVVKFSPNDWIDSNKKISRVFDE